MMILVSGATKTFRRFAHHPYFGHLKTPRNGNGGIPAILASGRPWACDNDAYSDWCSDRFRSMLAIVSTMPLGDLLWVACPDVVADARATLNRFEKWEPEIAGMGLPVALVGQDGAEGLDLPWDRFACLFIGGSTTWKLSEAAEDLVGEAKARGKLAHMGRVNTLKRLRHAFEIGCDTVDGTAFSRWPDKFFPRSLRWLGELERQPVLF